MFNILVKQDCEGRVEIGKVLGDRRRCGGCITLWFASVAWSSAIPYFIADTAYIFIMADTWRRFISDSLPLYSANSFSGGIIIINISGLSAVRLYRNGKEAESRDVERILLH